MHSFLTAILKPEEADMYKRETECSFLGDKMFVSRENTN
jgi:hypothetical protein